MALQDLFKKFINADDDYDDQEEIVAEENFETSSFYLQCRVTFSVFQDRACQGGCFCESFECFTKIL